jgi:protein-tyrosine phosphatase
LIKGCFDNNKDGIIRAVNALQAALREEKIALTLHSGAEYYLDEFFSAYLKDPLALGGSTTVLVEAPAQADLQFIKEQIYELVRGGHVPLVAHPERCGFLDTTIHHSPVTLHRDGLWNKVLAWFNDEQNALNLEQTAYNSGVLKTMGCKYQVNIGSVTGTYGEDARKRAVKLLQNNHFDKLGSDAHSPKGLEKRLAEGLKIIEQEIGGDGLKRLAS